MKYANTQEVNMKKSTALLGVKIVGGLKEVTTSWAGVTLLVDLFRKLEIDQISNKVFVTGGFISSVDEMARTAERPSLIISVSNAVCTTFK